MLKNKKNLKKLVKNDQYILQDMNELVAEENIRTRKKMEKKTPKLIKKKDKK